LGGIEDHLHLLVRLPTTLAIATLLKEVKGSSSHLVTHEIRPGEFFKWQGAYGAFTLAKADVPRVIDYIRNQREHHAAQTLHMDWERCEIQETDEDWKDAMG
jgi:REP element-mobilizing transposase RayT